MAGKKSAVRETETSGSVGLLRGRLAGRPAAAPLGEADKLLVMGRGLALKSRKNPYQSDFSAFCRDLVFTRDEAAGGKVAQLPMHDYMLDLIDDFFLEPLLLIEKSRRVLVSWLVSAFSVWILAGGQDERWPALLNSTENRQVILQARKLEDIQGAAWFAEARQGFIYQEFEKRGFRETAWPGFPTFDLRFGRIQCSNSSALHCVPQGKDQARGAGATLYIAEELAFWNQAKASIQSAMPVLLGGGHCIAVTTSLANSYAADLALDHLEDH